MPLELSLNGLDWSPKEDSLVCFVWFRSTSSFFDDIVVVWKDDDEDIGESFLVANPPNEFGSEIIGEIFVATIFDDDNDVDDEDNVDADDEEQFGRFEAIVTRSSELR